MTAAYERALDRLHEIAEERYGRGAAVAVNREARGQHSARLFDPKGEEHEAVVVDGRAGKLGAARALIDFCERRT